MPELYQVSNVEEAVVLASKFKREGKYDWFRGQTKDWPPHSSLYRLKNKKELHSITNRNYRMFINWVKKKNELVYLLDSENTHQLEAVLQHYGFPTNYIDFTTEPSVAGFFACDTNSPPVDGFSCIYCLDTKDLHWLWEQVKNFPSRKEVKIEQIIVDVSNLWRLQAQKGVLLFADYNWEVDYPLDKIVFPYTKYPAYPTKDIIYPEHKSMLETLLDEFFDTKRVADFLDNMSPYIDSVYRFEPFKEGYNKDLFKKDVQLHALHSWTDKAWDIYNVEGYHESTGIFQKISLGGANREAEIRYIVSYGVMQVLSYNKKSRTKALNWVFENVHVDLDAQKISDLLTKIWNGMRHLPFDDDDISIACGNLIYLHLKGVGKQIREEQERIFCELFGEGISVGFSIIEGNGARGFANNKSIMNALGRDFSALLLDKNLAQNPINLFSVIYNPKLMFDFRKFKMLYAREVLPSQMSIYHDYIIYNPFKLEAFGNY